MGRIDRESGRARGKTRKVLVALAVVALLAVPASYVVASDTFSDVPSNAFYHNSVNAIANAAITAGCTSTRYCPNSAVTRGQMAVFLDKLGNLSGSGPVVDALSLFGQAIVGFIEPFPITGGQPVECADSDAAPFTYGEYSVEYQLHNIAETAPPDVPTHEILVSIIDDPGATSDSDYQVCFRRIINGNLPAGTYYTYGTGTLFIGSGIFGSEAQTRAKIAQFREAKAK
jgi:hypothetical protein